MFCATGFSNIPEIIEAFATAHFEENFNAAKEFCSYDSDLEQRDEINRFYKISPMDWIEHSALRAISNHAHITSPKGETLKLDLKAIRSASAFCEFTSRDLIRMEGSEPEILQVPQHYTYAYRIQIFPENDLMTEYLKYRDDHNVSEENRNIWDFVKTIGMHREHHLVPLFYEREGFTITLETFDYAERGNFIENDLFRNAARILRPFEGWAICVPTDYLSSDEYRSALSKKASEQDIGQTNSSGGRPDVLRRETREAFLAEYPNGRGDEPWLSVLRKINNITGHSVSVDTLKRAAKQQN